MSKNDKSIKDFLDAIPDEKLKNFPSTEKTLVEDRNFGFRLDHQGVNSDGSNKDRLYIQPIGGKSKVSQMPKKAVIAQIHVTDPGDPKGIRDALFNSYKTRRAALIKLA